MSSVGITRRVARIVWLLGVSVLACIGYTIAGIVVLTAARGDMAPLVALLLAVPLIYVSTLLTAFYLTHVGSPLWYSDGS